MGTTRALLSAFAAAVALTQTVYAQTAQPPAPAQPSAPIGQEPSAPTGQSASSSANTNEVVRDKAQVKSDTDAPKDDAKLPWRGTLLVWEHSATTNTVGVGQDYQSRNPTYIMALVFRPRYYLVDKDRFTISIRGDTGIAREFTNSDATTDEGEVTVTDTGGLDTFLYGVGTYNLNPDPTYLTQVQLRAPVLALPTSKASYSAGRILGLGTRVGVLQSLPILGSSSDFLKKVDLLASVNYSYNFTRANVAVNDGVSRVRWDVTGRSSPSDQLSGEMLSQHSMILSAAAMFYLTDSVLWTNQLALLPSWRRRPPRSELCGVVATGCAKPSGVEDPQRYVVSTAFATDITVMPVDYLWLSLTYENFTGQVGPDGQRRSVFYSPDARFIASVTGVLDRAYSKITGRERPRKPGQSLQTSQLKLGPLTAN